MICFFKCAVYEVVLVGTMMKQAVGQRATYSLVKEDEHGGDLDPLFCQSVGIMLAIALNQPMSFHLPQIVAELIYCVLGKFVSSHDVFMKKRTAASTEAGPGVHDGFHQTNHARIVDLDARNSCVAVCQG